LIRRVAEAVGVASAILVGGSSNAVDLCDSHTRKKQRGRPRAYRRRSLNVWVAGCASGRVTRGNALFHGQVPNEAAQLLVRWLIGVGWAGRTLRRVRPVRSIGEYPGWTRSRSRGDALMVMAADYPFVDVLWSMIIFFFWVIWIWIVITVLVDVFRRDDIGGWAKAAWVVFVVILPWLGVLVYLIAQHDGMRERSVKQAQAQRRELDDYVRETAGGGSAADIAKAKELLDAGAITQQEFEALKAKALA
jgi:Short C-terminal domain/Phospholipase_D-nuclease N-terminal